MRVTVMLARATPEREPKQDGGGDKAVRGDGERLQNPSGAPPRALGL